MACYIFAISGFGRVGQRGPEIVSLSISLHHQVETAGELKKYYCSKLLVKLRLTVNYVTQILPILEPSPPPPHNHVCHSIVSLYLTTL